MEGWGPDESTKQTGRYGFRKHTDTCTKLPAYPACILFPGSLPSVPDFYFFFPLYSQTLSKVSIFTVCLSSFKSILLRFLLPLSPPKLFFMKVNTMTSSLPNLVMVSCSTVLSHFKYFLHLYSETLRSMVTLLLLSFLLLHLVNF